MGLRMLVSGVLMRPHTTKGFVMIMKKLVAAGAAAVLGAGLFAALPASAVQVGNDGCTPGYWKNHTDSWQEYAPSQVLGGDIRPGASTAYFNLDANLAYQPYKTVTFRQALSLKGGPGLDGATQILMRATVAAFLNAAHEFDPAVTGDGYPYRRFTDPGNILATVNAALASQDRQQLLDVASWLDTANNLGCPLN
jgi:hypothetical protein